MRRLIYQKAVKKKVMIVMRRIKKSMMGSNSISKKRIWNRWNRVWRIYIL
jgi:hypothetical protein